GSTLAEGHHRGVGTPHAEVDALARAGAEARGATAVVTREPSDHTGRTGPSSQALVAAGVRRVVLAQRD
ncbi:riboflavin biosynthesis protein RibD, partial [Nocardioides sp. SOB44]|nr:riboflavin biosynthesis protein RibD [Nocardioides cremeus]